MVILLHQAKSLILRTLMWNKCTNSESQSHSMLESQMIEILLDLNWERHFEDQNRENGGRVGGRESADSYRNFSLS